MKVTEHRLPANPLGQRLKWSTQTKTSDPQMAVPIFVSCVSPDIFELFQKLSHDVEWRILGWYYCSRLLSRERKDSDKDN